MHRRSHSFVPRGRKSIWRRPSRAPISLSLVLLVSIDTQGRKSFLFFTYQLLSSRVCFSPSKLDRSLHSMWYSGSTTFRLLFNRAYFRALLSCLSSDIHSRCPLALCLEEAAYSLEVGLFLLYDPYMSISESVLNAFVGIRLFVWIWPPWMAIIQTRTVGFYADQCISRDCFR